MYGRLIDQHNREKNHGRKVGLRTQSNRDLAPIAPGVRSTEMVENLWEISTPAFHVKHTLHCNMMCILYILSPIS